MGPLHNFLSLVKKKGKLSFFVGEYCYRRKQSIWDHIDCPVYVTIVCMQVRSPIEVVHVVINLINIILITPRIPTMPLYILMLTIEMQGKPHLFIILIGYQWPSGLSKHLHQDTYVHDFNHNVIICNITN